MTEFKKQYKKLYKSYKKRLNFLNKTLITSEPPAVEYLVTYLSLLRDRIVLLSPADKPLDDKDVNLASLVTALNEYNDYVTCVQKYYNVSSNGVLTCKQEFTQETAQMKYQEELQQHWEAFWNLVKLFIEDWSPNA